MNCCSCLHARQAGNNDVVGCSYWTAIFHGNIDAMKTAFDFINKKENYNINLDSASIDREAIGFLIDVLIEDYAPKPLYEGWANLQQPYGQKNKLTDMTDGCVVIKPQGCCDFYTNQYHDSETSRDVRAMISTR